MCFGRKAMFTMSQETRSRGRLISDDNTTIDAVVGPAPWRGQDGVNRAYRIFRSGGRILQVKNREETEES